jgi:P27 family predicted phage terminase small subunit
MPNPPTPLALRRLQGNPGKRAMPTHAPEPPPETDLTAPSELDATGRVCWRRNAPVLAGMGVLTDADRDALMLYCDAYSQWRHASRVQRRLPPADAGYRQVAVTVETARNQMRLLMHELGLTPTSRVRLVVGKPADEADPMEDLLRGRSGTA